MLNHQTAQHISYILSFVGSCFKLLVYIAPLNEFNYVLRVDVRVGEKRGQTGAQYIVSFILQAVDLDYRRKDEG
jgi:hypothetical protein